MNFLFPFATEGFGLNFNLFETNILNLAVVIFGLYKFLPSFLGKILERRRSAILTDLQDAEDRLKEASKALEVANQDLANAQQKADSIRADSQKRAEAIRAESEKRTIEEMVKVKEGATSDLNAEAARVTNQLRLEAAQLAIAKALKALPSKLDKKAQTDFLSQSINNMGQD